MLVKDQEKIGIKSAADAAKVFRSIFESRPEEDAHKESFYVMGLDSQNRLLYVDLVAIGSVNFCHPIGREVFRLAIVKNAVSIIVSHNHPSGNITPSPEDRQFTRELKEGGKLLNITLLDHIIIGDSYYSFGDNGHLVN